LVSSSSSGSSGAVGTHSGGKYGTNSGGKVAVEETQRLVEFDRSDYCVGEDDFERACELSLSLAAVNENLDSQTDIDVDGVFAVSPLHDDRSNNGDRDRQTDEDAELQQALQLSAEAERLNLTSRNGHDGGDDDDNDDSDKKLESGDNSEDKSDREDAFLELMCQCLSENEDDESSDEQKSDDDAQTAEYNHVNHGGHVSKNHDPSTADGALSKAGANSTSESECDNDSDTSTMPNAEFRLFAVVSHAGKQATEGHYVSDVCDPDTGDWLRYDDSMVTRRYE
jgi:hypothetical protein